MASSAASIHFLSVNPQSLPHSNLNRAPASLSLFSFPSVKRSLSLSCSIRNSRVVRNVAFSDQIQGVDDFEEETPSGGASYSYSNEPSFPPELKLFVGNLPFNVESATLAGLFSQAGSVEMAEVIYDKQTGRSRGFGFVTMSTVEEVEAAAQQFNGYELEGRPLRVNSGPPPPKRETSSFRESRGGGSYGGSFGSGNRLHVGNLSWGVDEDALESLFSEHGKVMEAKVVYDRESGRSKGFGFVTYSSSEEASSAAENLNGAELNGRQIRVSPAESRPPRRF
ncbi:PREDICTED: 29 kDa ribonucleoprotein A, chloroplastic-like [Ipomoea nil]|uniref:29 kDa ribonucleoprotein A, chloroplastic-like n=1 Tax=Ipomoea nil TaxID=35883 RepID=UPI000901241D|nr:PREDICTED: 29 kDa ribonucleoprotein A, chloroplastic-like [Ipomoea nil]XP_019198944.1 PREDICTED: 29 kDa ribonucleoprotein A, chloroplastic-like [Ipomoea nil]XP_019198945.1 PREDICTED: 29 kDa ribonucleoprotein A, chloroplastic-like [Ipomoea nil]